MSINIGDTFNRWTVIETAPARKPNGNSKPYPCWLCRCSCGTERVVAAQSLRSGHSKSCGCLKAELTASRNRTHGMSGTSVYRTWAHMLERCKNKNCRDWPDYGGRGITVCPEWHSFEAFYADMGDRPEGLTIHRVDNDGNYEPGNCVWADEITQSRAKRNTSWIELSDGRTVSLAEAEETTGIKRHTLARRAKAGGDLDKPLPSKVARTYTLNGQTMTAAQWAKTLGIHRTSLYSRLKTMSLEEALTKPCRYSKHRRGNN